MRLDTPCIEHGKKGNRRGYASCWFQGRYVGEHVKALILKTGEEPAGRVAMHRCDNPRCINPAHLRWGTHSDNSKDCVEKGRHANNLRNAHHTNRLRGEQQRRSRWTDEQVRQMRTAYASGETQTAIAKRFGCRQSDVSRIVRKDYWRHVI